ncbi:MAG: glycosyltransferase [Bacteroides sp.]
MKILDSPIIVSVCCLTYNHEKYVRQCLDGFIMQKTNFIFEILVHDDASTDKTQDIIREYEAKYPHFIKPVYQKINQYSQGISPLRDELFPKVKGKYIAICEGDDYWIDPLKLQKQIDFLETHEDYGLIHTDFIVVNESKIKEYRITKCTNNPKDLLKLILLGKYDIGTLTVLFRKSLYDKIPHYYKSQNFLMGDLPLWIEMANETKFKYLESVTAAYRRLDNSASHSTNFQKRKAFIDSLIDCRLFYIRKLKLYKLEKKIYAKKCIIFIKVCSLEKRRKEAIKHFFLLVRFYPSELSFKAVYYLLIAFFPIITKLLIFLKERHVSAQIRTLF